MCICIQHWRGITHAGSSAWLLFTFKFRYDITGLTRFALYCLSVSFHHWMFIIHHNSYMCEYIYRNILTELTSGGPGMKCWLAGWCSCGGDGGGDTVCGWCSSFVVISMWECLILTKFILWPSPFSSLK